ncbi:MAG TPA: hypothetical protein VGQ81_10170 [Acidobacteriota bacterium]|jgi:hypothetical protein|nr:hypothetical protein [Acidobacteriota bacterium]
MTNDVFVTVLPRLCGEHLEADMHFSFLKKYRFVLAALLAMLLLWSCSRKEDTIDVRLLQDKYGLSGAYSDRISTPDGNMEATIVPITLANGQRAQLLIPRKRSDYEYPVYMHDQTGMYPVVLSDRNVRREEFINSRPAVVERRVVVQERTSKRKKRSFEKEALIVGGSAGAGALIGAVAGGKKGAGIGALSGGVAGLVYDLATRHK